METETMGETIMLGGVPVGDLNLNGARWLTAEKLPRIDANPTCGEWKTQDPEASRFASRWIYTLLVALFALIASISASNGAPANDQISMDTKCTVLAILDWNQNGSDPAWNAFREAASFRLLRDEIFDILFDRVNKEIAEGKRNLSYISSIYYCGRFGIYDMGLDCREARPYLRERFREYKQQLSYYEAKDAPDITISDESVVDSEIQCDG